MVLFGCYDVENGVFLVVYRWCTATLDYDMSLVMRKPDICICGNKDADQLHGKCEADQRLCCYTDSSIPLLPKAKISSL